jgi:B12-binding domain/radical SAM domain protein, MJ_1487 family
MRVNWRYINASRNSYAILYAACEREGHILHHVKSPDSDITCYSLNSINESKYRDEIESAQCITIVGGPHASASREEVAGYADYVIVGEGEYTLPRLLSYIGDKNAVMPPGVATKNEYTPAGQCVLLDYYPPFSKMKGYVEISRGCPFRCAYCQTPQIFGHCMHHRSIDTIVSYSSRYRDGRFVTPNAFAYGSDGIRPRFDKVRALLEKLPNNIYFGTFPSEVRPEFICDTSLDLVNDYCRNTRIHFGAQSGSNTVLKMINRGHTVEDVIRAVECCRDHDLIPVVDFIVGLPNETEEDQKATCRLIRWIVRFGTVHAHQFMPLPGTELAGCKTGPVIPDLLHLLGSLSLKGKLTGSWGDPQIRFSR